MVLRKFLLSVALLSLTACGFTPKADVAGKDKPQKPVLPCEGNYNPISLFIPERLPLTEVENLPPGLYVNHGVDFFAVDDQTPHGIQEAHFQEVFFGESGVVRPVCHTVIDASESADYRFPALKEMTIPAAGPKSRSDATYRILNSRGTFTTGVVPDGAPVATGLSGLIAKFNAAYLYRTGLESYELHGEIRTTSPRGILTLMLLQRIQYIPPESK